MSNEQNPAWLGPHSATVPQPTLPQPNAQTHAMGDVGNLMREAQQKKAPPKRGYHRFELPETVKNSMQWKGSDADRHFGMWEPTAGEVRAMVKRDADIGESARDYIAALGIPQQPEGTVMRDETGEPVMAESVDGTRDVLPWWHRLSPKAQQMIQGLFMEFILPTQDEGKSLRASRKWVAGA